MLLDDLKKRNRTHRRIERVDVTEGITAVMKLLVIVLIEW
jgi:hypothetical protein